MKWATIFYDLYKISELFCWTVMKQLYLLFDGKGFWKKNKYIWSELVLQNKYVGKSLINSF